MVDVALVRVPVWAPSTAHTVHGPTPTQVNSWQNNPLDPGQDPVELVSWMVPAPVVVT